jgi:hypothetical protein
LWTRTYGGSGNDYGCSVQQTSDGGYIITGYTASFGAGGSDVWLIKTDALGDTTWTKTFGGGGDDRGYSVQQTTDGGYVVSGSKLDSVYLIKTDSTGNTLWTKTYKGSFEDCGFSVKQTTDGGYIIAGHRGLWLIKTDSVGDTLWTKKSWDLSCGCSVQKTIDNGYIVAGFKEAFPIAQTSHIVVIKTDTLGDIQWRRTFGKLGYYNEGRSVQQTSDGGYIVAGYADEQGSCDGKTCLLKISASGDSLWMIKYESRIGLSVQRTTDGGYIIGCFKNPWLIKTNDWGDTLWTKSFEGYNEVAAESVHETSDGGYIITGGTDGEVWLIKTAPDPLNINKREVKVISEYHLSQNYPNPFNPSTNIEFDLPKTSKVTLKVFNILGEEVATLLSASLLSGSHSVEWDASNLASGVYLYRLQAGDYVETRKMVLMR